MENVAYPQLVYVHGEKYENQVFWDVVSETRTSFTRTIPESMIGTPKPTNHPDWLFLLVSSIQLRLWNPVTLQSIDLPLLLDMKVAKHIDHVFLTKTPDHPDCVILLWMKYPHANLFCYVNGDGDQTWTHQDYHDSNCDHFGYLVACDDDTIFTFSLYTRFLIKTEIVKPPVMIRQVESKTLHPSYNLAGRSPYSIERLVACCGDMFVIRMIFSRVRNEIDGVIVLQLDYSMSWNIVDSCPNAAFFISGAQAISCPIASADSRRVGNRVCFTGFFDDDDDAHTQFLYTYHIQQKKLKVSLLRTPDNASQPYWTRVPDARALLKAEEDYRNGGDGVEDLVARRKGSDELLVSNDYHVENRTVLSDLPVEILRIISSHLINPVDYLSFRAARKCCLSIGHAKEWRNILGHIDINSPLLMAPSLLHKGVYSMVDPVSRNKYYTLMPETLNKDSSMCHSSDGRILMYREVLEEEDGHEFILRIWVYNPLTKYAVCLPKSPYMFEHLVMAGSVVVGVTIETYRDYYFTATEGSESELEWEGETLAQEREELNKSVLLLI